jgi:hypothetical protein
MGIIKMGAYKELFIEIQDSICNIAKNLEQSIEDCDVDQMKLALRGAIVNSALTIAFIEELEN